MSNAPEVRLQLALKIALLGNSFCSFQSLATSGFFKVDFPREHAAGGAGCDLMLSLSVPRPCSGTEMVTLTPPGLRVWELAT